MVRFKNRWLLVEFISKAPNLENTNRLNGQQVWSALKQSVLINFGDIGWGSVGMSLSVKYFSPITNICIIRVARDHHRIAWGALTLISSIEGLRVIPNVIHVSGTIKHAQLAAIHHNREVIARYRAQMRIPTAYQDSFNEYLQSSTAEIGALQD